MRTGNDSKTTNWLIQPKVSWGRLDWMANKLRNVSYIEIASILYREKMYFVKGFGYDTIVIEQTFFK